MSDDIYANLVLLNTIQWKADIYRPQKQKYMPQILFQKYSFAPHLFTIFTPVVHCAENQQHDPAFNAVCKTAIFTAALRTLRLI